MRTHHTFTSWGLVLVGIMCSALDRGNAEIRQGDIPIEVAGLRGWDKSAKGWKVPPDWGSQIGSSEVFWAGIGNRRFGLLSGGQLYTTWRAIVPLTEEIYAEGKTTIYDNHRSELLTPPFEVKLDYITFLLSGGRMPGEACINLLVDGKVMRTVTGENNDLLNWVAFDVKDLRGKEARIQVLDTSIATFGYITIDCVCQSPDPKGATRIIATPPTATNNAGGRVETVAGMLDGIPEIAGGELKVGGQTVGLDKLLRWETGIAAAESIAANRLELVNGDLLVAEVLGLEKEELLIKHAGFKERRIPVSAISQALFQPIPPVKAKPGTLIHSNGNEIPGELLWIRDDNISIKCSLGVIPLSKARVRAFVFSERKPTQASADAVLLADGSTLSGKVSLVGEKIQLAHDSLGMLEIAVGDVSRITRRPGGVTPFANLEGELIERVGPITPPVPVKVKGDAGDALRMFPRTTMRYKLPKAKGSLHFRAKVAPIVNSRTPMTVLVRAGGMEKSFMIPPDGGGIEVDMDLGKATEVEIIADSSGVLSYPCGIELRNAFIMGGDAL